MASKNGLITGVTNLLVLSMLKNNGDSYVYEICKYITNSSKELLSISHNTVYTAMYKLEEENMISEYSQIVGRKRTRIYYHIEPAGKEYLKKLEKNYLDFSQGMECFFSSLN